MIGSGFQSLIHKKYEFKIEINESYLIIFLVICPYSVDLGKFVRVDWFDLLKKAF